MNKVIIIGKVREIFSTDKVFKFSAVTSESWKSKEGETKTKDQFHTVVMFGEKGVSTAKTVSKGDTICVEGKLMTSMFEKDGVKKYNTEINAYEIMVVGGEVIPF